MSGFLICYLHLGPLSFHLWSCSVLAVSPLLPGKMEDNSTVLGKMLACRISATELRMVGDSAGFSTIPHCLSALLLYNERWAFTAEQSFKLIKSHPRSDGTMMYLKAHAKK